MKNINHLLYLSLIFVLCACNKQEQPHGDNGKMPKFNTTSIDLTKNGNSDYKIVLPLTYSYAEGYAAQELQEILYDATGCQLPIVSDSGLVGDNSGYYLSVGNTSLYRAQSDIVVSYDVQGESGVQIQRKDNSVYMIGATDRGTLNSVYQFLYYEVGFKTYAYDYTYVDYNPNVKLLDFDFIYKPNIEWSLAVENRTSNPKVAARMYTYADYYKSGNGYGGGGAELDGTPLFSLWCHDSTLLVPSVGATAEYWNNGQLCLTNDNGYAAFKEAFINQVCLLKSQFAMIGPADVGSVCNCQSCTAAANSYGGFGGVFMRFANRLANDVENYFVENNIDRNLIISILAYQGYSKAPVIKNGEGKFVPAHESVVAKESGKVTVGVCYAPITACYTHPFGECSCDKNKLITENLCGWGSLANNIFMYTYGTNFSYLTYPFNNWQYMNETFKFFEENNVRFLFDQSDSWNGAGPFSEMRSFIRSSLSWDSSLNVNDLMEEFISKYYGPGANAYRKYFDLVQHQFDYIYQMAGTSCHDCYYNIGTQSYWPRSTILELESCLSFAMSEIERIGLDSIQAQVYHDRFEREYIIWKTNELTLYEKYLSGSELEELKQVVAEGRVKYNINRRSEHVID